MGTFLMVVLSIFSVFLILLVLIQQGRGGGLSGAFGGMGGQSAFGTRAGDVFTRITIGVASVWILLCILTLSYFSWRGTGKLELNAAEGDKPAATQQDAAGKPEGAEPSGAPSPASGQQSDQQSDSSQEKQ